VRPRTEDLPIRIRRLGGNGADGPELPMAHRACPSRSGQSAPGRKPKTQMKRRPPGRPARNGNAKRTKHRKREERARDDASSCGRRRCTTRVESAHLLTPAGATLSRSAGVGSLGRDPVIRLCRIEPESSEQKFKIRPTALTGSAVSCRDRKAQKELELRYATRSRLRGSGTDLARIGANRSLSRLPKRHRSGFFHLG
jgi:hypothetical protein